MKIYATSKEMKDKIRGMVKFIFRYLKLRPNTFKNLVIRQKDEKHSKFTGFGNLHTVEVYTYHCHYELDGVVFYYKHPDLLDTKQYKLKRGDEFLFATLAHELRHTWQCENNNRPYVKYRGRFPKKPKYTNYDWKDREYDCMLFEEKMLKKWRKHLTSVKKRV